MRAVRFVRKLVPSYVLNTYPKPTSNSFLPLLPPSPRRQNPSTYFVPMVASFGTTSSPRASRPLVENTPRVTAPPATALDGSLARETLMLVVGGVEQPVEVERHERPHGGSQGYWRCPKCERLCCDLFVIENALACRVCHRLSYHSQRILNPAVVRAEKLRRKLGAAPGLLSPIPPRPPYWSRAYYGRLVAELAAQEAILAGMFGDIVKALERRKGRLHGPRR